MVTWLIISEARCVWFPNLHLLLLQSCGSSFPAYSQASLPLHCSYFCVRFWGIQRHLCPQGSPTPSVAPLKTYLLGSPPLVLSLGSHGTWLLPHHHPHRSLTSKAEWSQLGRTVGRHWSFSLTWELFQVRGCVLFVVDLPAEHPAVIHEVLSLLFPFDRWGN